MNRHNRRKETYKPLSREIMERQAKEMLQEMTPFLKQESKDTVAEPPEPTPEPKSMAQVMAEGIIDRAIERGQIQPAQREFHIAMWLHLGSLSKPRRYNGPSGLTYKQVSLMHYGGRFGNL